MSHLIGRLVSDVVGKACKELLHLGFNNTNFEVANLETQDIRYRRKA